MTGSARPIASGLALVALLLGCTSDDPSPAPSSSPTSTAAAADPTLSPKAVTLDTLDLPEDCQLFDEGRWDQPIEAGEPAHIDLRLAPCARAALDGLPVLAVEWTPSAFTDPAVSTVLNAAAAGRWAGTVTFTEPGMWRADPRIGIGSVVDVIAADAGLVSPSPDLPLPAAPQTVAVLDGDATDVLRTFNAEQGGIGLLRDPDRAVFVQARDGGRWLVIGDVENGEVEPLFEVAPFTNIYTAPDGRAVAVEWGDPATGVRELRIVTAAGDVTAVDDGATGHMMVAWTPDSSALFVRGDSLWVLEPDGAVRKRLPLSERDRPQIAWPPASTYALLWYGGQNARLVRLDLTSLDQEVLLEGATASIGSPALAPDGERIAIGWWTEDPDTAQISVISLEELATTRLEDHVVASFQREDQSSLDPHRLSWSPDGEMLALSGYRLPVDGRVPTGSVLAVLEVNSGDVRRVAEASDFYSGQEQHLQWSTDGSTLFALRYDCSGCEPGSSAVDVIDVSAGRIIETFEDTSFHGMTEDGTAALLSTPEGLVRRDGRMTTEPLIAFPGGIFFWPPAVTLAGDDSDTPLTAVQLGVGRGQQIFAARTDGTDVELLDVLGLEDAPFALLDDEAVVVRGREAWERRDLASGASVPYIASNDAREKFSFEPSPSGDLALDRDAEGFAVLDVQAPEAPALAPRRAYPGGVSGVSAWSADERLVAFGDGYTIGIFDLDTQQEQVFEIDALSIGLSRDDPFDRLWALTWTEGGALEVATPSALWRLDVEAGTATEAVAAPRPGGFTQGSVLAYGPDGETLVAGTQFGMFVLDGGAWRQLSAVGLPVVGGSVHWAPDGAAVAFAGASGHAPEGIIVAPLDGGGAYRLVASGAGRVLGWLPDGRLAWVSATGGV